MWSSQSDTSNISSFALVLIDNLTNSIPNIIPVAKTHSILLQTVVGTVVGSRLLALLYSEYPGSRMSLTYPQFHGYINARNCSFVGDSPVAAIFDLSGVCEYHACRVTRAKFFFFFFLALSESTPLSMWLPRHHAPHRRASRSLSRPSCFLPHLNFSCLSYQPTRLRRTNDMAYSMRSSFSIAISLSLPWEHCCPFKPLKWTATRYPFQQTHSCRVR